MKRCLTLTVIILACVSTQAQGWVEETKLSVFDSIQGDLFGTSISVSGTVAIIGADSDDDNGSNSGAANIFEKEDGTWIEKQKFVPFNGASGDQFGNSVAIYDENLIVGSIFKSGLVTSSGSVYIYEKEDTSWVEKQEVFASDSDF